VTQNIEGDELVTSLPFATKANDDCLAPALSGFECPVTVGELTLPLLRGDILVFHHSAF
jgi:hypothetical protein